MTTDQKATFLREEYIPLLRTLSPDTPMRFGKLSQQGVVEHMADSVRIGNGKDLHDPMFPPDVIEKSRSFMLSDKPFREGTPNPLMSPEPPALRHPSYDDAIGELEAEFADFFDLFAQDREKLVTNPFFGELNYEHWVHLLYKHAWHHLRQAGVEAPSV
jgi:hypothetical protein